MATSSLGKIIHLDEENAKLVLSMLNADSEEEVEKIRKQNLEKFKKKYLNDEIEYR